MSIKFLCLVALLGVLMAPQVLYGMLGDSNYTLPQYPKNHIPTFMEINAIMTQQIDCGKNIYNQMPGLSEYCQALYYAIPNGMQYNKEGRLEGCSDCVQES